MRDKGEETLAATLRQQARSQTEFIPAACLDKVVEASSKRPGTIKNTISVKSNIERQIQNLLQINPFSDYTQ
ncbi:MAG: hypothetical protein KME43_03205 [Myxacorys chilensis ATA2-1-KO14]|jgi:hypothetical protein|nr:hypothetical protein [Myxacorys chilensis ATA2-1-KO14]